MSSPAKGIDEAVFDDICDTLSERIEIVELVLRSRKYYEPTIYHMKEELKITRDEALAIREEVGPNKTVMEYFVEHEKRLIDCGCQAEGASEDQKVVMRGFRKMQTAYQEFLRENHPLLEYIAEQDDLKGKQVRDVKAFSDLQN